MLKCPLCGKSRNIQYLDYKFHLKGLLFKYKCPDCNKSVSGEIKDRQLRLAEGINIIRWDAKQIDIEENPITGEKQYYYSIPDIIQDKVRMGDKYIINSMPLPFLKAVAEKKLFQFAPGKIYHMKTEAPAGISTQWGFPILASTIKLFFYTAVLKKANEAIALEHLVPFRVLSPSQSSANADPVQTISLSNWVNEMKLNLKAWRRDPLHLMFSPVSVNVTNVGGQGRALMVTGEIVEAENAIIAAMGIPREFIYGGLSATGSGVTLRMIENQLLNFSTELVDEAQWIADACGKYLSWDKISLDLEDPKLIDDVQQKMVLLQANQAAGGQLLSNSALASMFSRDLTKERDKRFQDTLDEQKFQIKLQNETAKLQNTLSERARSATQAGQTQGYDQQQVIAQAESIVQQLMQMDPGSRRSQLHSLQTEDYVMYSVVIQRLQTAQTEQEAAMRQQAGTAGGGEMPQEQMGGPSNGGGPTAGQA
jgi:hypothetical protein